MTALFSQGLQSTLYILFIRLIVAFIALPVHECAHGYAALRMGDHTAEREGRLTLNPFAHFDFIGTTAIILFGFGWAKPVPINPLNFENPKKGMMISALAGPLSNIGMAFLSMVGYKLVDIPLMLGGGEASSFLMTLRMFFSYAMSINITLGVFNLIPIPPLDGSRVATYFLPSKWYFNIMRYERYAFLLLLGLLWFGFLDGIISFVSGTVISGLDFITRPVDWLVMIIFNSFVR